MKALISGVAGQDGIYLSAFLKGKGYEVHGIVSSDKSRDYLSHVDYLRDVKLHFIDITKDKLVRDLISQENFDEIYNLAGQSSPSLSFQKPHETFMVNTNGVLHFLEAIRLESPDSRFYQASTSELFGGVPEYVPQDELTPFHPKSPYGVSKLASHNIVINYRETYGLHCCSGILFNHESKLRGKQYVTKKICDWVKSYAKGVHEGPLTLGNLAAKRDWGHSKDFVKAMWMILNTDKLSEPYKQAEAKFDEYVVGTGKSYSIKEFVECTLSKVGKEVEWRPGKSTRIEYGRQSYQVELEEGFDGEGERIVTVAPEFWRPNEVREVRANCEKILRELGWKPVMKLDDIIDEMMEETPEVSHLL